MSEQTKPYMRFNVIYELVSPVRIGHRKVGNLQTTRYYIPGNVLWASAVRRLVGRFGMGSVDGRNAYDYWGDTLKDYIRFSYLFLLDEHGKQLIPEIGNNWKESTERRSTIESRYIFSTAGTPLNPETLTVEEGMLHELEWISNIDRVTGCPTTLAGHIDILQDSSNQAFQVEDEGVDVHLAGDKADFFDKIVNLAHVGADLRFGYGRLRLKEFLRIGDVKEFQTFPNNVIPGHVVADAGRSLTLQGRIETVVGRSWEPAGEKVSCDGKPGRRLNHFVAYVPGTIGTGDFIMDHLGRFRIS